MANGFFVTGSGRRRLSRHHTVGIGATVRRFAGNAWSAFASWRFANLWGHGGLRLEHTQSSARAGVGRFSWDQDWRAPRGWVVATSLGLLRYSAYRDAAAHAGWSAALSLASPIGARAQLRAALRTEHEARRRSFQSLNLSAHWRTGRRWSLEGWFSHSLGRNRRAVALDPLAPPATRRFERSDRSFSILLRYELDAGSRSVPLSGGPAEGGGAINGVVYFDDNDSGAQEASEAGVANAIVVLDGRYSARTDSQGRFTFPFVASGSRALQVSADSLPLPWHVIDDGRVRLRVRRRAQVSVAIPVRRSH